ncbi:hypothetical protein VQ042_03175 [Aurantimonas sp. A2-1-M11]|uniref:hypothetical protein n=1 Tax=Aurantimonas sp. A2-1-M11 TaxID=3113712 RepID=UPI002F92F618
MSVDKRTYDNLWTLIAAPLVWALHFLFSYTVAAYACAPQNWLFDDLTTARIAIGVVTLLSLIVIAYGFRRAWRDWSRYGGGYRHDQNTPEDRERFFEFSTLLLAALSFIGVIFSVLPAIMIADCR